jgi:Tol biopolymer transport system component
LIKDGQRDTIVSMNHKLHLPAAVAALTLIVVASAVLSLLGCRAPQRGRQLAFVTDRDGNWEIYLMDIDDLALGSDGNTQVRLTRDPAEDWLPSWSPDGKHVAFVSDRSGEWELYAKSVGQGSGGTDIDGIVQLTDDGGDNWDPSWSPDGSHLVFSSRREGNWEVYVIDIDFSVGVPRGAALTRLTTNPANDWLPTWSPDGRRIAFVSDRDGDWEIYVMEADGSLQTNLTRNPADDWVPAWSPDGKRIAYQSDRDGDWEIYDMDVEGDGQRNLTNHPAGDWDPTYSVDGLYIAFMSDRDGNREVYVLATADNHKAIRLTDNPVADKNPAWAP